VAICHQPFYQTRFVQCSLKQVPTLISHGHKDKIVPPAQSHKLYDLISAHKEIQIMEGSAHAIHLDQQKDTIYGMISAWIKRFY
jgi:esterase/lipase